MVYKYSVGDLVQFRRSAHYPPSGTIVIVAPFIEWGKVTNLLGPKDNSPAYIVGWQNTNSERMHLDVLESEILGPWDGVTDPNRE